MNGSELLRFLDLRAASSATKTTERPSGARSKGPEESVPKGGTTSRPGRLPGEGLSLELLGGERCG